MTTAYYQRQYERARTEQARAEREGDMNQAEAYRQAGLRWLEMESRVLDGLPEIEDSDG